MVGKIIANVFGAVSKVLELWIKKSDANNQRGELEIDLVKKRLKALDYSEEYIHKTTQLLYFITDHLHKMALTNQERKLVNGIINDLGNLEKKYFKHD